MEDARDVYGLHCPPVFSDQTPPDYCQSFVNDTFPHHFPIFGSPPEQLLSSTATATAPTISDATSAVHKTTTTGSEEHICNAIRNKIASHPLYPKLLQAYIDCQKVGAPSDIANLFEEIPREDFCRRSAASIYLGDDPELDEFMETYCEILVKYKSDLARPFDEATTFLNNIETQLRNLCNGASRTFGSDEAASSEEDIGTGEVEVQERNPINKDRELKDKLFRKYSGYISSLKHEFSNKKKKPKLPGEARQALLDWWTVHYMWPYPTEADKVALAESTGLDQKQINNWFINQRKRHWKPSENMQFDVMESVYGPLLLNN